MTRTFDEWSNSGFLIRKGSKCVGFRDGKPLFTNQQVVRKPNPICHSPNGVYDDHDDGGPMYGIYGNCD